MGCCCVQPAILRPGVSFGVPCAYGVVAPVATTTSTTTYATHQTLAVPAVPAGDYFVGIDCYVATSNPSATAGHIQMDVLVDGASVLSVAQNMFSGNGSAQGTERLLYDFCAVLPLAAGAHTVQLNYRVDPITGTFGDIASVAWSSIEVWRFAP